MERTKFPLENLGYQQGYTENGIDLFHGLSNELPLNIGTPEDRKRNMEKNDANTS